MVWILTDSVPRSTNLPFAPSSASREALLSPAGPAAGRQGVEEEEEWLRIGRHSWPPTWCFSGGDATLMVSSGGPLEARLGDHSLRLSGPRAALFLPDRRMGQVSVAEFDGLLLRLQSSRLKSAAALISGHHWNHRRFGMLLQEVVTLPGGDGPAQRQLLRLGVVARLLDPTAGHPPGEIRLLALDDVLDRLVVLALWWDWLHGGSSATGMAGGGNRDAILDDLVDWIRANSHRPLHLAELEKRSGYSERSLRNAFQERFGCPPKQWIRRTRMESAHQRLLDPGPNDTVSTIAREHGYQHVSQFSRDFRCVFGLQPSLVMRQARRSFR